MIKVQRDVNKNCLFCVQGGWNKNKYNKTGINEAKRRLAPLKTQLRSLKADIALLQQCVQVQRKYF